MTEIPYEIELDDVQWCMLQEALADGRLVTFTKNCKRIQMKETD